MSEADADAFVDAIARDWRAAPLNQVDQALCAYAEKLTRAPCDMGEGDVERLRAAGLDDVAIHDATQIIGFFNYINRVADALGVEPERFVRPWGEN
ncbi:MAG: hypothetical protein OXG23_01590 [Chloroflexi bacterium]|nr:hypothetical protein [Chloroflexota bacterium]